MNIFFDYVINFIICVIPIVFEFFSSCSSTACPVPHVSPRELWLKNSFFKLRKNVECTHQKCAPVNVLEHAQRPKHASYADLVELAQDRVACRGLTLLEKTYSHFLCLSWTIHSLLIIMF